MAFGAGWTTARDRGLLIQLGRGPARVAVADVPGINAFGLVTSANFVPSPETEALVTAQDLLVQTYGDKGRQILADAQAYADGVNAYWKANNITQAPATVNDVIAVTAFIGSIFGAGGGGEASNSNCSASSSRARPGARLQGLGRPDARRGPRGAHHDQALLQLPGADRRRPTGSVVIDPGSIESSTRASRRRRRRRGRRRDRRRSGRATGPAGVELPGRRAVPLGDHNSLATMGPQLGYFYPEIVQQIDLHGPASRRREWPCPAWRCTS